MVYSLFIKMCIYSVIIIVKIIFIGCHDTTYISRIIPFFIVSYPPIRFSSKEHNF